MLLAQDLVERVRANRSNAEEYDGLEVTDADSCETDFNATAGNTNANDEAEWSNAVRCLLGNGEADVTVDATMVVVTLSWAMRYAQLVEEAGSLSSWRSNSCTTYTHINVCVCAQLEEDAGSRSSWL
jgi:hypothetical protein